MKNIKDDIVKGFSKAAAQYEQFAMMQQRSLDYIHAVISRTGKHLPSGSVLEVGCGTGALSRILVEEMPERPILFTDLSPAMLAKCRDNLSAFSERSSLGWQVMDGENLTVAGKFALIVSALTLQWFQQPVKALAMASRSLVQGGKLIYSYVGADSFAEWREVCARYQIPCTANPLPDTAEIELAIGKNFSEVHSSKKIIRIKYPTVHDFFYSLKKTGSATPLGKQTISIKDMRKLLREWQGELTGGLEMTYTIHYLTATAH